MLRLLPLLAIATLASAGCRSTCGPNCCSTAPAAGSYWSTCDQCGNESSGNRCSIGSGISPSALCGRFRGSLAGWFASDECQPRPYASIGYEPMKDKMASKMAAHRCCRDALRDMHSQCGRDFSADFCDGFECAFVDVALGGRGVPPAVPPEKYWRAYNRTPEGHARAEEWFQGYRLGAMSARERGMFDYNYIPTSVSPLAGEPTARDQPFDGDGTTSWAPH